MRTHFLMWCTHHNTIYYMSYKLLPLKRVLFFCSFTWQKLQMLFCFWVLSQIFIVSSMVRYMYMQWRKKSQNFFSESFLSAFSIFKEKKYIYWVAGTARTTGWQVLPVTCPYRELWVRNNTQVPSQCLSIDSSRVVPENNISHSPLLYL